MIVEDQKPYNAHGGSSIAGVQTRTLNTVTTNTITGASLASNQVTLPAGTYRIDASAPALTVSAHRVLLKNVTNNTNFTWIATGTREKSEWNTTSSKLTVVVTFTATTVIRLDHETQYVQASTGLGGNGTLTMQDPSVYARMVITKIG
jgi:hypothetical protein